MPFKDTMSRTDLGPTQPPIQWVQGVLSVRIKRPRREAANLPPSSAEDKECVELYLHSQYVFMEWCLVKHRNNLCDLMGIYVASNAIKVIEKDFVDSRGLFNYTFGTEENKVNLQGSRQDIQ
jgi:hypothetical protein